MNTVVELKIFSPRRGCNNTFIFSLGCDSMEINMQGRNAKCRWLEDSDPVWSGEPLKHIMSNDKIYPPEIFQRLIEHAWKEWRNGELNDEQVKIELDELASWLNKISQAKPATEFWIKRF